MNFKEKSSFKRTFAPILLICLMIAKEIYANLCTLNALKNPLHCAVVTIVCKLLLSLEALIFYAKAILQTKFYAEFSITNFLSS